MEELLYRNNCHLAKSSKDYFKKPSFFPRKPSRTDLNFCKIDHLLLDAYKASGDRKHKVPSEMQK